MRMKRSLSIAHESESEDETKSICIPPTMVSSTTSSLYAIYMVYNEILDCLKGVETDNT